MAVAELLESRTDGSARLHRAMSDLPFYRHGERIRPDYADGAWGKSVEEERPLANRAELIFAALGYPDPVRVDLGQDNKRACKALGQKWPYSAGGPWIYHLPGRPLKSVA